MGLECRSSTGLGETETPLLEAVNKFSCVLGPRAKQLFHRSWAQTYLWVLEGLLWGQGQWWTPQRIPISVSSPRGCHFGTENWPHPTAYRPPVLGCLRPNNQQGGNTAPTSSRQAAKFVLSQQPPMKTHFDMAMLTRRTRLISTHQWAGTSPSHQQSCRSQWTNLNHQEADTRTKKNYNPAA